MALHTDPVPPSAMTEDTQQSAASTLDLVRRVGASATFERSPRLRELLFYICEQAVQQRPEDLKEQVIGRRVFGRAPDYSPGDDNIVRVEVRQLRKRLEEYFSTEGKAEPVVIAIPKGGYIPAFEPREAPAVAIPAPVVVLPPEPPARNQWLWPAVALAGLLLLMGGWVLVRTLPRGEQVGVSQPDNGTIWPLLFDGRQQTMIVCADSTLVMAQVITRAPITLEDYVQHNYTKGNPHLKPTDIDLLQSLERWQFTDIVDVRLVQRISRLNSSRSERAVIRSARTVELQDFKTGNVILLGSSRSNPWNLLFEPQLNFRFGYDYAPDKRYAFIQNMAPRPGEDAIYRAVSGTQSGWVYSTVSFVPDLRHKGNVLIVAGTTAESTETAGEFITNPEATAGLMRSLMNQNHGKIPYFEVLLKSGVFAGVAQQAEVVASRILASN